jgi:1,2-diacylglycerol 3-alpha-glucosyltransferase
MRIAIFSDTYPPQINGVATSTYNLVKTLRDRGEEVLLITVNTNDKEKTVINNDEIYIPGLVLKKLYGYRIAWIYNSKVFKYVKNWKPDIIHYQTDGPLGIFARIVSKKLKLPIVYTYHTWYADYTHYATKGYFDRFAKKMVQLYSLALAKNTTEFIAPTKKSKESLRMFGADAAIRIVPTGSDFSLFK